MIRLGNDSPWGTIDSVTPIGTEGAAFVTTAGHGGIYLPTMLAVKMPKQIVDASFLQSPTWWEEDCDAAWPTVILKLGTEDAQARALDFLSSYKPALIRAMYTSLEIGA